MSFFSQVKGFQKNYWIVNVMEVFERLAFFSVRAVLPLWMVATADQHGLGLTFTEKGLIFSVWAACQSLIPMFSGSFTDNFGYKRSLYTAFSLNIFGYILMANATGFWTMMIAGITVGTGTAIFKPPVQGTIASSVNEENSSLGFGIFYWIVNIGGFIAPLMASALRGNNTDGYTWHFVFYAAAVATAVNFIPTIFFYKEPAAKTGRSAKQALQNTLTALKDKDFMIFLMIFSGFWLMFMQLWDLLPNFIDQWIDSRDLAKLLPAFLTDHGSVKAEQIININALCIILFMVPWSIITGKFPRLVAITAGIFVTTFAFLTAGLFMAGTITAICIVFFSFGEMTCSPKFSEYIGVNAPADKKALYMGLANIPFALGWIVGNMVSGPLYDAFANKLIITRQYLLEVKRVPLDTLKDIVEKYKGSNPDKLLPETIEKMNIETFNFFPYFQQIMGVDQYEANRILWEAYHPWRIWVILSTFGFITIISMLAYSFNKRKNR
ncbi:MAG TPA: MFS transporter [bacterium]|nr:MFS transporter [bacterium]HPV20801.1 MFS transporter [bacterium]HPY13410.1 MFS transporter [bacterium]HQM83364.1 MFS transporter [bacterium]HRQ69178.1 MFS transporter [bacterium]